MFRRLIMKSKEYKRLERILQKTTKEVDRYEIKLSKMQELCDELLEAYYEGKDISESISKIRKELWCD